jgi:hypothetical protein
MRYFSASQARSRLAEVLDIAEAGQPVLIGRAGVQFQVSVRRPRRGQPPVGPMFEILDPAVDAGCWTWVRDQGGLRFAARAERRRRTTRRRRA